MTPDQNSSLLLEYCMVPFLKVDSPDWGLLIVLT